MDCTWKSYKAFFFFALFYLNQFINTETFVTSNKKIELNVLEFQLMNTSESLFYISFIFKCIRNMKFSVQSKNGFYINFEASQKPK